MLRLLRNVSSNYLRAGVDGLIVVLLTPVVVHSLGIELYAVWVIVQTLAYYLGFLDFGITEAQVQRHAVLESEGRSNELGRLHGTVLVFYLLAGVVAILLAVVLAALPTALFFDVPADAQAIYTSVLVLSGLAVLFAFADSAIEGVFEGYQRYDLANGVDITVSIVQGIATFAVLSAGYGMIALAVVVAAAEALKAVAKLMVARRTFPAYSLPTLTFERSSWRAIRSFSLWNSLNEIVTEGTAHLDKLLIPILLTASLVTPYSLVLLLSAVIFVVAEPITDTYLPIAATRHAKRDPVALGMLLTRGTKMVNVATLPVLLVVACFGQTILDLWIGEDYTQVEPEVLWFTAANFYFSTYLWTSLSVLLGVGLVKRVFWASIVEVAIVFVLILILVPRLGLSGLALAGLIGNVVIGFKCFVSQACRMGGLASGPFVILTLLRPMLGAVPGLALGLGIAISIAPNDWFGIVLASAAVGLTGAGGVIATSSTRWERARWYAVARRVFRLVAVRRAIQG